MIRIAGVRIDKIGGGRHLEDGPRGVIGKHVASVTCGSTKTCKVRL